MAELFDSWRPRKDEVVLRRDWERFCPYNAQSPALQLSSTQEGSQPTVLPLFGSASAAPSGSGLEAGNTSGSGGGRLTSSQAQDVLLSVGGPVWALDLCPAGTGHGSSDGGGSDGSGGSSSDSASASQIDYLAAACHPQHATHNVIGQTVAGPGCIQVWEVSRPGPKQQGVQGQPHPLPRMALALAHEGGLVWHCQWCPSAQLEDRQQSAAAATAAEGPGSSSSVMPRLGLLAAALGDGSLQVWAVPHPRAAGAAAPAPAAAGGAQAAQQQQQQQGSTSVQAPLVLSIPPVAAVSSAQLGGSLPCLIDWLPAPPHDLLLVGCWDGTVAVFKLAPHLQRPQRQQPAGGSSSSNASAGSGRGSSSSSMYGLELLCHISAEPLPVRTLRWAPPAMCAGTVDDLHRHLFLTGGHEGAVRIWDFRDPFAPQYAQTLASSSTILAGEWTAAPFGIIVGMEDASLRGVPLDSHLVSRGSSEEAKAMFSITWRGTNMGAVWALAVQPTMQLVAYAGEDGELGVFRAEFEGHAKRRMSHTAVGGLRLEGEVLCVQGPAELQRSNGLFRGRVMERTLALSRARLPEEVEALHRVAWSRHSGDGAWLASGGAAGLVRCQWIRRS